MMRALLPRWKVKRKWPGRWPRAFGAIWSAMGMDRRCSMHQQQSGKHKGPMLVLFLVAGMGMPCRVYSAQKPGVAPIADAASQGPLAKASSGAMRGSLPLWVYYAL